MFSIYGRCGRSKSFSFLRILENAISSGNNKQRNKKAQELVWKFIEKHMKIHEAKIPWSATKEDNCGFFMIARPLAESLADRNLQPVYPTWRITKSQATSYKYRLCSHSLQQSMRHYSFFSRSAKPAGGFKQLHKRVLKGEVPVPFPSPFFFKTSLHSAQIPFPLAEFGKNPSVIHTTSFRFASAKLRLLNTTQQRPKNSQGFTKIFRR